MTEKLATELVTDVLDNPGCDVVQRLAIPMPIRMIAQILGVPECDADDFRRQPITELEAVRDKVVDVAEAHLTQAEPAQRAARCAIGIEVGHDQDSLLRMQARTQQCHGLFHVEHVRRRQ